MYIVALQCKVSVASRQSESVTFRIPSFEEGLQSQFLMRVDPLDCVSVNKLVLCLVINVICVAR